MKNKKNKKVEIINKFKLNIYDRLMLPSILPDKANYEKAVICEDIRDKVKLSQNEIVKYKVLTLPNGSIEWNDKLDKGLNVIFTPLELEILLTGFNGMNNENRLPTNKFAIDLYRKFINK